MLLEFGWKMEVFLLMHFIWTNTFQYRVTEFERVITFMPRAWENKTRLHCDGIKTPVMTSYRHEWGDNWSLATVTILAESSCG